MGDHVHSDIAKGDWIDCRLPHGLRPYARLMRLDRPIGSWLLLLPCWWSVALSSTLVPNIWHLALFALGAVIMRGAGCVINDIYDRDIDKLVERTRTRPLASGALPLWKAVLFACGLLALGLLVLLAFNSFTFWLGVSSLLLVFTYPLAKRVTWWPQLVLGLAFNWGALMGWSAQRGQLDMPSLFLYLGGIFWTLGYDTLYAHQDKRDDRLVGIKSLALFLGERSRAWVAGFYAAALFFIILAAWSVEVSLVFYYVVPLAIAHATWQLASWNPDDPTNCLKRFRSNRDFGLIVFAAFVLGKMF